MPGKPILMFLVLSALTLPASQAHAAGAVASCDEAHLRAALAGGGEVTFTCSGTITLTAPILIAVNTRIDGSGQNVTVSGNGQVQVFSVDPGAVLSLDRVTVADGWSVLGSDGGGGVDNRQGTVIVYNSTFSGNAGSNGGGIRNYQGYLMVSNSTFYDNDALHPSYIACGGGIYNANGTVVVTNSTLSGNSALEGGGAICNQGDGAVTLRNTIVAGSGARPNCSGTITDGGGNLSYPDTTCPGINGNPVLGSLRNNGGPTPTMALGPGSVALDAANDTVCAQWPVNGRDQRGFPRPWGPHCDIGAYELFRPSVYVYLPVIRR